MINSLPIALRNMWGSCFAWNYHVLMIRKSNQKVIQNAFILKYSEIPQSQNVRKTRLMTIIIMDTTVLLIHYHLHILIPAKFNCTVPGTLFDCSADCPSKQTTFSTTTVSSTLITTATATNLTMSNERQPSKFEVGSRLFNIVVGVGGGMVMLLVCCLSCVCVVLICRQRGTKGESKWNQHSMHIIV